jgi:hypothetical protein
MEGGTDKSDPQSGSKGAVRRRLIFGVGLQIGMTHTSEGMSACCRLMVGGVGPGRDDQH